MDVVNLLRKLATDGQHRSEGGVSLLAAWHNGLFCLFLVGVLAYGILFASYLLSRFDLINLIRDVSYDDAFYYFQIARNMAAGQFSTFDGGITRTNGYHPFWMLLITPFYWFNDPVGALFYIKGLEILLIAGAAALIVVAARLTRLSWWLLFALLPQLYKQADLFRGMEAAALLFMLGLFLLALVLYAGKLGCWRRSGLLAAVAFALPWVRLECIAISLAATAALGALAAWREEPDDGLLARSDAFSRLTLTATAPLLGAIAGILVYFSYNWLFFDSFVPVSGAVKYAWSQYQWEQQSGYDLVRNFKEALRIPIFGYEMLIALEICAYFSVLGWLVRRSDNQQDWMLLAFLTGVFGLAAGHLAQFAQTVLTVHPAYHGQFPWYFVPAYLMTSLIIPVRCFVVLYLLRRFVGLRWHRVASLLSTGVVAVGAVLLLVKTDIAEPFRFVDRSSGAPEARDEWAAANYLGIQVANRILPEDSVLGSWDAGVIGYFSRFPVVNLDGLVNSYGYFREINRNMDRHVREFFQLQPLHRQMGITHKINLSRVERDNPLYRGRLHSSGRLVYIAAAMPPADTDPAAGFWERIAPHFVFREGDIGLVLEGRIAMAVARNCAPTEILVWSWALPGEEPVFQPGTNTGREPEGICVSERVLPAPAVDSVRAVAIPIKDYLARLAQEREPIVRSNYDVYRVGNHLIYTRERCETKAVKARFFLHLYPADPTLLDVSRQPAGFDNFDFEFPRYGVQAGGVCLVSTPLPEYDIIGIRTGQFVLLGGEIKNIWKEEVWGRTGSAFGALSSS